ncbi:MAG: signal recognition particle protein [Gammaproteobacteria bacterium]|nr:signal recognition particle protein [Gammaproteobacteria bacterium]
MFNKLSNQLGESLNKLRGIGRLTEANIKDSLTEIRRALIKADVALPAIAEFIETVQTKATGQTVISSVRPGEAMIKLVQDELTHILGDEHSELNLKAQTPIIILMAGLQGSGKTTTTAKLALWLKSTHNKSVLVTSADIYRPAAIEQLATLAKQAEIDYFPSTAEQNPVTIAKNAIQHAKTQFNDVVIIDTAGRLQIDDQMMNEIKSISQAAQPTETLLVVDSMAGQDAANVAKTFNEILELTGVVLTKTDGDARGGAALSMRMITGKPIKFMGVGEKIDALQAFHPERVASRILGMGDIVSLVEEAQHKVDQKQAKKLAKKIKKGKRFDFNDFLSQLNQMKKMGGLQSLMAKLPGAGAGLPKGAAAMLDDKLLVRMESIIGSMTPKERHFPALINGSRKRRIANGSGNSIQDVNKLLKQFTQMQKMLKRMKGNKMLKRMQGMKDQLPPDLLAQLPDDFK